MEIRTQDPVAVIGAGAMGLGIAQVAAMAGHCVTVVDADPAALVRAQAANAAFLDGALAKGRIDDCARTEIAARIGWSTGLEAIASAALVIEAIVEDLAAKQSLFRALEQTIGRETVLATNTSSLGIGAIASQLARPERCLGLHFFNPVPAMKLVEIISGPATESRCIAATQALMAAWGKVAIRARDVPGFIVNRVARPYYAEGFIARDEGVDPATIDAALCEAGGFRMGPLALADLIGHDVNYAVASSVFTAGVGVPRFRPQAGQQALVASNRLGRKTGRGVYDYAEPLPQPARHAAQARAPSLRVPAESGLLEWLVAAARTGELTVIEDPILPPEILELDGIRLALGDGRSLARRTEVDVLIDHARFGESAASCVFSARSAAAAQIAADLLGAVGRSALRVPDRPGQIVLRTLAQLANAAADTVFDAIASAADVETAMQLGANHPEGALTWAQRVGPRRVRAALAHIAAETGDAIYQPSPLFDDAG